jgi:hypothetical protein
MKRGYARRIARAKAMDAPRAPNALALVLPVMTGVSVLAGTALSPSALVLPVVTLVSLAAAASAALLAGLAFPQRDSDAVTLWDVAGGCTLIGVAAAIMGGSDRAIELLLSMRH